MTRPALIGIGGHVVGALVEQLGAVPGLAARVELHLAPDMPGDRPSAAPDLLARACVVLAEAHAIRAEERAALAAGCTVITLPHLAFASLWPHAVEHPPRLPDIEAVAAPFGDRLALEVLRADLPPEARRAAHDAASPGSPAELDRRHAEEAAALFLREQGCDIRVAGFVLSRFRAERLFHSPAHPAAPLLLQVMAQLLGHPAIAALADGSYDARLQAVTPNLEAVFADAQAPVHPAIAAHFRLAWWSSGLRYRQGDATRSFSQWVDWHLREPPPPAPVTPPADRGLAVLHEAGALAEVAVLQPETEITRAAPFFATTIDPAIAPQGAALLSAESGRYRVAPVLLAALPEAVVLGHGGAVLRAGTVLGDTLAPRALPPTVRLPPRRRIDGAALLGFGPGWQADPHGMTTILPRLVACARLRRHTPALRILLPRGSEALLAGMLALLGLDDAAAFLPNDPVACSGLLVTGRFDPVAVAPVAIEAARALAALVPLGPPGPRLLYLRHTAPMANAPEVEAVLAAQGFTVLDADTTPLPARIAALRSAAAVVAAQGPALAEIAFCPPGTPVLELVGPADPSLLYWSIASCAGLSYGYIVGDPAGAGHAIPPAMLTHAVSMMAAATTAAA